MALGLIGVIWWQIETRGSFLVRSLGSDKLEIDFSLLLSPSLGLLALGLLVLRFFPIGVAILAKVTEPLGPVWLVQGLRRVSRDPIMPGTLVVLLMLATALGVIGSAFSSTLERSQKDRALYTAGADLRIRHDRDSSPVPLLGLSNLAEEANGVVAAAEVKRGIGSLLTRGFDTARVSVLAVESDHFARVAWYRPDFAGGKSLEELISPIMPGSPSNGEERAEGDGIMLPRDATALALWVNPGRPHPQSFLLARLQDSRGYYFDVSLGELGFREWRRLEAGISSLPPRRRGFRDRSQSPEIIPPFTLLSLQVSSRRGVREPGVVFLEDLTAITPSGEKVITDFRDLAGWHVLEDYSRPGLFALESSESVSRVDSERSVAFSWAPGSTEVHGIRAGRPETPVPAVVSRAILDIAEARVGDTLNIGMSTVSLPIQVVAVADFFPTLDPREDPFIVVDLRTFTHYTNLHLRSQRLVGGSSELWVNLDGSGQTPGQVAAALDAGGIEVKETHLASEIVSHRVEQPLVNASWGGLLVLIFLTLVLASASGVMLFSYMDTRERQTEFALLRTLGFSRVQINGVVWFNLILVVVCGVALGTWAGQMIGTSLLPILEVSEGGVRVTPPMVLQTDWVILLMSYLVLAGVTASTVVWLAWLTGKLEVQRVLRIGEA